VWGRADQYGQPWLQLFNTGGGPQVYAKRDGYGTPLGLHNSGHDYYLATHDLGSVMSGGSPGSRRYGQRLVQYPAKLLREGRESAMVTGELSHVRAELGGECHSGAVGELPFRCGPGAGHDPRRGRLQRLDVGPAARGRADHVGEKMAGRGTHPGDLLRRRFPPRRSHGFSTVAATCGHR
jgi:hypothetical protein